jgi:thiol-disulfide isomerase/thioredoxin
MMKPRASHLALFAVLAVPALAVVLWWITFTPDAPEVEFNVMGQERVALSQWRGHPVLVNFWSTTCAPCVQEMPALAQLYRELHPQGLEVVGVAMNFDTPARVYDFTKRYNVPYPVALDLDGTVARRFRTDAIPHSFLINAEGQILMNRLGIVDVPSLKRTIVEELHK